MKNIARILFSAAFIWLNGVVYSQVVNPSYSIGTWAGFRSGAVCFTFDDGCPNQFSVMMPMFNEYGFKMTFFTVINWNPNWPLLQTAANTGHEIASHTMSHANLSDSTADQLTEFKNSQDTINARISGQKCITIAYPYCAVGNTTLCGKYYIAARICSGAIEKSTPADFMNISSLVCGSQGSIKTAQDFYSKAVEAASTQGWVVFLIHAIDGESGYSPINSSSMRGALDSLNAHKDKYWVSTFSNITRYIKERNNVSLKELSVSDSTIVFQATDTLDNEVYNYPITIRRQLPNGWTSIEVSQKGKIITSQIVEADSKKYIMIDVVPDGGDIIVHKTNTTGIQTDY